MSKYSDFNINFYKNEFVNDISMVKDRNSVRQSLINIMLTRPGEKPFNPGFGVGLHNYLFETWTKFDQAMLHRDITWAVRLHEPRAEINSVTVDDSLIDSNEISLNVDFFILTGADSAPIPDSLKIGFKKVR